MAVSSAKRLAIKTYQQKKCDRLTVDVPKGKRDAYKAIAAELGLSLSMLIQNSVETFAGNHVSEVLAPQDKLTAEQRRLLDGVAKLPESTRKIVGKLVEDLAAQMSKGGGGNGDN